jgi:hypothetical protein
MWWCTHIIPATWKVEVGESQAHLGKSVRTYLKKQTESKRTGDMAQMIEYLLSKHEVLSSKPSTTINR